MDTTILVLIIMLSLTFSSLVGFVVYFLTKKQNNRTNNFKLSLM